MPLSKRHYAVHLKGRTRSRSAISLINRVLRHYLAQHLISERDLSSRRNAIFIHHDYQTDFKKIKPPRRTKRVAIRTWDFGKYPPAWVERLNSDWDELWVHSHWVKQNAIAAGVERQRVRVMAHGIDPRQFSPEGPLHPIAANDEFRFLFVGGAVPRKGIDILLKAYAKAFHRKEPVALVIKDFGGNPFYSKITWRKEIDRQSRQRRGGRIHYLDQFLSTGELASLYRACPVSVFPYRAEGFGLPILEAMACGSVPLVPRFGACLDYCSDESAVLIPARRISLPVYGEYAINALNFRERVNEVDFCEVDAEVLAAQLREVYLNWGRYRHRRDGAVGVAHRRFTWDHTGRRMHRRLQSLVEET